MAYATCYTWRAVHFAIQDMRCPKCGSSRTKVSSTDRDREPTKSQTWRYIRCLACLAHFKTIETIVPYARDFLNDDFPTINPDSCMGRYVKKQRNAASKLDRNKQNLRPVGSR